MTEIELLKMQIEFLTKASETFLETTKMLMADRHKKKEWRGLTDADIGFWGSELALGELGRGVLRAVDAHLKEKNHG